MTDQLPRRINHVLVSPDDEGRRAARRPVNAVKYNIDGRYVISGGHDRKLHLWNASTGSHVKSYEAHGYAVADLAVSSDSKRLASVGGDKLVFHWDVVKGVTLRRFGGHFQRCNCVAFAGIDDVLVVSGSLDATCRIWDTRSNSQATAQTLEDATDAVTAVSIDDVVITTASADGKLRSYDLRAGKLTTDYVGQPITSVKRSKDKLTMLVASLDGVVRLFDADNGTLLQSFRGHLQEQASRLQASFGADQSFVACGSEDGRIVLWDVLEGNKKRREVVAHAGTTIGGLDLHPQDTTRMVSAGNDGTIVIWA
ncbi:hypothetical protein PYCC9005_000335 [Savitreella phatthalungensis]